MPSSTSRSTLIDSVKGVACATIVAHHLAFYGPMSDIAQPLMPGLIAWLYEYGRMAVQVFLVLGGFLAAARFAAQGSARWGGTGPEIGRRFVRLAVPYAVALVLAVLAAAAVRPWLDHPSVPGGPSLSQLVANALMLQDIVGESALSAGVWYVAIDFQLFALTALLLAAVRRGAGASGGGAALALPIARAVVVAATALSLWELNRHPDLDVWAVYFFGAYGLGMMAHWAVRAPRGSAAAAGWLLLIGAWGAVALALEFRARIAVAWGTALWLVLALRWLEARAGAAQAGMAGAAAPRWMAWRAWPAQLGRMSYSVFLVHFPVCLLVNAAVATAWPDSPAVNALGMALALLLSLAAGRLLYDRVERHVPSWTLALRWQAGVVGTGLVVVLAAGRLG
ncbi:acyltransferase family protein [Paracidovorax anthurii]|uniref:Peptidoglycan/LPS O-acetylase OafA/YrhL n=1 Tax=Paracidovorax anthurii TaxID=78229 RepID=A0A328Z0E7_9BURK|nr:acyltransferase family protein [Paracidovorax anthurii]RAR79711.1 peptidoglycan/LPS O-acetylase OafA/YrhL [Paracidovorax anthurii]